MVDQRVELVGRDGAGERVREGPSELRREPRAEQRVAPRRGHAVEDASQQVHVDLAGDALVRCIGRGRRAQQLAGQDERASVTAGQGLQRVGGPAAHTERTGETRALRGVKGERQVVAHRQAPRGDRVEKSSRRGALRDVDERQPFAGHGAEAGERLQRRVVRDPMHVVEHEDGAATRHYAQAVAIACGEGQRVCAVLVGERGQRSRVARAGRDRVR